MVIHVLVVMCMPKFLYKSLDVRYTAFFYNCTFRERDYVGAVVTSLSLGQAVTLL